jgi:hypothetical protein
MIPMSNGSSFMMNKEKAIRAATDASRRESDQREMNLRLARLSEIAGRRISQSINVIVNGIVMEKRKKIVPN